MNVSQNKHQSEKESDEIHKNDPPKEELQIPQHTVRNRLKEKQELQPSQIHKALQCFSPKVHAAAKYL